MEYAFAQYLTDDEDTAPNHATIQVPNPVVPMKESAATLSTLPNYATVCVPIMANIHQRSMAVQIPIAKYAEARAAEQAVQMQSAHDKMAGIIETIVTMTREREELRERAVTAQLECRLIKEQHKAERAAWEEERSELTAKCARLSSDQCSPVVNTNNNNAVAGAKKVLQVLQVGFVLKAGPKQPERRRVLICLSIAPSTYHDQLALATNAEAVYSTEYNHGTLYVIKPKSGMFHESVDRIVFDIEKTREGPAFELIGNTYSKKVKSFATEEEKVNDVHYNAIYDTRKKSGFGHKLHADVHQHLYQHPIAGI